VQALQEFPPWKHAPQDVCLFYTIAWSINKHIKRVPWPEQKKHLDVNLTVKFRRFDA
jgi:hypothetical protein